MNIRNLISEDRAVSPVIGVILMVAITVILAAVIGAFVIGIGDDQEQVPQASWDFSQSTEDFSDSGSGTYASLKVVEISHQSGETISQSNIDVTVDGEPAWETEREGDNSNDTARSIWDSGDGISAGDRVTVGFYNDTSGSDVITDSDQNLQYDEGADSISAPTDATELSEGDTVRVVWTSDSGGDSSILADYEVN